MKTVLMLLLAAVGLGVSSGASAQDDRVTVELANPQKFSDFKTSCVNRPVDVTALAAPLERSVKITAGRWLPEGQRMEITVSNIDMAGDIEVWRKQLAGDLRGMEGGQGGA